MAKRSADLDVAFEWLEKRWPELREKYALDDIFNCDETAVFFRALPDRGYVLGKAKPSGGKVAKERLTFMVTANYTTFFSFRIVSVFVFVPAGFSNHYGRCFTI